MRLEQMIERLSADMRGLGSGPLAELRRMKSEGPGAAAYWHLAARCGFLDGDAGTWMRIVRIMAILTPRGERAGARPVHDPVHRLGAALCDGGDPGWSAQGVEARPAISEFRLARVITERPKRRAESIERLARMLAARRDPARGINCVDIARLLLYPDDRSPPRDLARAYYRRLDSVTHQPGQEEDAR